MLKFSKANAKLEALYDVEELQVWLENDRKVYSFDLLSGWSCPFAKDCLSKVYEIDNRKKLIDGKDCKFRCFSASQEVAFPHVYKSRKNNFNTIRRMKTDEMVKEITHAIPKNLGICRIHVAGDYFNQAYFDAWRIIAQNHPDRLFYAYTKSICYWLETKGVIPHNFILTASRGGRFDEMIDRFKLREAVVVYSEDEAKNLGLEIDHDDSHAAVPLWKNNSFALLIHGIQPAGSRAAEAVKVLRKNNVRFSYSKNSKAVGV